MHFSKIRVYSIERFSRFFRGVPRAYRIAALTAALAVPPLVAVAQFSPYDCGAGKGGDNQSWSGTYEGDGSGTITFRIAYGGDGSPVDGSVNVTVFMDFTNFQGIPGLSNFAVRSDSIPPGSFSISHTTELESLTYEVVYSGFLDFQNCEVSGTWRITITSGGTGVYAGTWSASGYVLGGADGDGDGVNDNMDSCPGTPAGTQVDANGCPIVAAGEELFWDTSDGNFGSASSWQPAQVPTSADTATFGQGGASRVTLPTLAESAALSIVRGDITLVGGRWNVLSSTGVRVGVSSSDAATLKLEGSLLTSESGIIGSGAGTNGSVTVGDATSSWLMSASLIVGNQGAGSLTVKNGGRVTTGGLLIGDNATGNGTVIVEGSLSTFENGLTVVGVNGTGSLEIDNAGLTSESAEIGSSQGATGTVTVKGATGFGKWTLTSGDLIVGSSGNGTLTVSGGNRVEVQAGDFIVAQGSGSTGTVTLSGAPGAGNANLSAKAITIGQTGSLTVETGAVVETLSQGTKQITGLAISGKLTIAGDAVVIVNANATLGAVIPSDRQAPIALLALKENGEFRVFGMTIGNEAGTAKGLASGTVMGAVRPKLFGTRFTVYAEGRIQSTLSITGTVDVQGGTVALGTGTPTPKQGVETEPSISIDGDLIVDGGTIEVEVAGLDDGQYGLLEVTGTADLMDATLVFQFMDGFLPKTGDAIPFMSAAGGLTSSNLSLQFDGVADGFDFQIMEDTETLMFEALNDAEPAPAGEGEGTSDSMGEGEGIAIGCAVSSAATSGTHLPDVAGDFFLLLAAAMLLISKRRRSRRLGRARLRGPWRG